MSSCNEEDAFNPDAMLSLWRFMRVWRAVLGRALVLLMIAFATQEAHAGFLERVDIGRPDFAVFVLSGTITGGGDHRLTAGNLSPAVLDARCCSS